MAASSQYVLRSNSSGSDSRYFSCKDWRRAVVETVVGDAGDASVRNTRSSWWMITSAMVRAMV